MKPAALFLGLLTAANAKFLYGRQVFSVANYNDLSISGGVAGNAAEEAFSLLRGPLPANPEDVTPEDLDFLNTVNQICNDAETEAFNPAIEAAEGEEAEALQRGKIKNKVLKLTATMLKLTVQAAQGEDVADRLEEENTKLQSNIQQDEEAAGLPSTFLSFDATT